MSLGHVYIVLEPVGSAHLTFDDDRYYEFMCFDVPKVVRSPECDHGHVGESQNGRDIKIDILEGYVWTPNSHDYCRCQNRRISGRGSRTVRLRRIVIGGTR